MSADRVKTPFDKMVEKFNEMLVHVDVSPDYRRELRSVVESATTTVTKWFNKFNEPEPFNVETVGQILTVFKEENISLKEQLAASQAENAELRAFLQRVDAWLIAHPLGGFMTEEKTPITSKNQYVPNKNIQTPQHQTISEGYNTNPV